MGDRGDLVGHLVGDVDGHLGIWAGHLEREDSRGGGAGDGRLVALEAFEAERARRLVDHAITLEERGHVVGDHLGGRKVRGERVGVGVVLLDEHVHAHRCRVGVGHHDEAVDAHRKHACQRQQDDELEVLPQEVKQIEECHSLQCSFAPPHAGMDEADGQASQSNRQHAI